MLRMHTPEPDKFGLLLPQMDHSILRQFRFCHPINKNLSNNCNGMSLGNGTYFTEA